MAERFYPGDPAGQNRSGTLPLLAVAACVIGAVATARALVRSRAALDLAGKRVLVTGGSRGLGLILARKLAAQGARVAICARDPEELARARQDIGKASPGAETVVTLVCDLTDKSQTLQLARDAESQLGGPIEILIHNAGLIQVGPMETQTEADYEEALRLHFWAAYHLTHAVLPSMRARRQGRIALIASIGGKVGIPHLLPYSTSKFALVGFGEGLRAEVLKDGILVTTVCPGTIRTGSPRNAFFKGQHEKEFTWFSVGDSLPILSQSADRCADEILDAVIHGDAELVTSLPGRMLALLHGLLPGLTADLMGQVNKLLPAPGGIGTERRKGYESQTALSPSILTALTEKAEDDNNQK
ncbi:MAG: SDR family NAD(P)-dependent oxidoreductase [Cytophagales bacterium]|nr:SDR family NAD(P)-dependent oxidoreductase [Armatimonadota bacterium]